MSESVVGQFMQDYETHFSFYLNLASDAETRCRKALKESGIPAVITSRAKDPDSLLVKLCQRDAEKHYQSTEEISRDLADLVGVRMALYFPDQEKQIEGIMRRLFQVKDVKRHDKTLVPVVNAPFQSDALQASGVAPEGPYTARFHGYRATHFRVKLQEEEYDNPEDTTRRQQTTIEVQVASLLMHAWSEVNHNLAYKTLNGQLSTDELRMLDGINGLVLTGEVLLGQLKASVEARIAGQKRPFSNYFEMGAFVQRYAPYRPPGSGAGGAYRIGSLSDLLYVTRHLGIDNPEALVEHLERWSTEKKNLTSYPLVQSILDSMFAEWDARTPPTLERPFLQSALNVNFQSESPAPEQRLKVYCHILAHTFNEKLLSPSGGDKGAFCLPPSYQWLHDAGCLVPHAQFDHPAGDQLKETEKQAADLWDWLVKSPSARVRVSFGVARARAGNECMGLDDTV
jgi:ppGpp synthetase/RelA/SpoT-type nucleotidyltranferase